MWTRRNKTLVGIISAISIKRTIQRQLSVFRRSSRSCIKHESDFFAPDLASTRNIFTLLENFQPHSYQRCSTFAYCTTSFELEKVSFHQLVSSNFYISLRHFIGLFDSHRRVLFYKTVSWKVIISFAKNMDDLLRKTASMSIHQK